MEELVQLDLGIVGHVPRFPLFVAAVGEHVGGLDGIGKLQFRQFDERFGDFTGFDAILAEAAKTVFGTEKSSLFLNILSLFINFSFNYKQKTT